MIHYKLKKKKKKPFIRSFIIINFRKSTKKNPLCECLLTLTLDTLTTHFLRPFVSNIFDNLNYFFITPPTHHHHPLLFSRFLGCYHYCIEHFDVPS